MKINQKIMSAILGSVLIFYAATLISCKNQPDSDSENSTTLKGVTSLFIVNPTKQKKNYDDTWVKIETVERAAETETKPIRFTSFNKGTQLTFEDHNREFIYGKHTATLRYVGNYFYLWTFDDEENVQGLSLTDEQLENFSKKFDSIYLRETALCGPKFQGSRENKSLISPNDKISIIFYDIGNDKQRGTVGGYFTANTFYNKNPSIEALYIDSYCINQSETYIYSVLVHEFNHMLNYVNKTLKYGLNWESWYTEMLSMLTEDFFTEELDVKYDDCIQKRLESFITPTHRYGFGNWQDINNNSNTIYNYANAYAFGAYLVRNYGGAELMHEIATNAYINEDSVVQAVNKINGTTLTFNDLLKEFPAILINTQNNRTDLPSLNKEVSGAINADLSEYNYHLKAINLDCLREGVSIRPDDIKYLSSTDFDSYGFLFFDFKEKTDINLSLKDFLIYSAF